MLLTIGMMVKNEEKYLEKCLDSLQPILKELDSELIIVDTGSEDKTVDIAKRYTEKVYFHKWNNNFSEMRNITIEYAQGEWFFCIDGDEVLNNPEKIIEFFKTGEYKKYNTCSIKVKNYSYVNNFDEYGLTEGVRIFKKDDEFRYEGSVHNEPIYKNPIKSLMCHLEHYGYLADDEKLMEKKFIRTSNILKNELKKNPDNIYYRYQLAVSYSMHGDRYEALYEIEKLYNKMTYENKKKYKYVLGEYALILFNAQKYKKCEEICKDSIKLFEGDEIYKIDLAYFLARSQGILGDNNSSEKNYLYYLSLLQQFKFGNLNLDLAAKISTASLKEEAYIDLAKIKYIKKEYKQTLKYLNKIKNEDKINYILQLLIDSYIKLADFSGLLKVYQLKISKLSDVTRNTFFNYLETVKQGKLHNKEALLFEKIFSEIESSNGYAELNKLRIAKDFEKHIIYSEVNKELDLNKSVICCGEIIYIALKNGYDVIGLLCNVTYKKLDEYLQYCKDNFEDFNEVLFEYVNKENFVDGFIEKRIQTIFYRALLIWDKIDEKHYLDIFEKYIDNGIHIIKIVYSDYFLENVVISEFKNDEHRFMYYMLKFKETNEINNKIECISNLKKALYIYPCMNKGIKFLLEKFKRVSSDDCKMNDLRDQLLININILIKEKRMEEALNVLIEYENIAGSDFNSLFYKSMILKNKLNR